MARLVFVVGKSGMGKSTSCRNLNPDETVIINSDQKDLPFPKFSKNYNNEKGNYLRTSNINEINAKLKEVHNNKQIKTVIIDTWSRIMTDEVMSKEFRNASNGMQAWSNMAFKQYSLINIINEKLRDDLIVYLFCHPEIVYDESGYPAMQIAVQGKQLKKFIPESFSSIILYSEADKLPGQPIEYYFRTSTNGEDTCKTPIGMFEDERVPNDLVEINKVIHEYYA